MKKKSNSRTGRILRRFFNVTEWVDLKRIVEGKNYIISLCERYLILKNEVSNPSLSDIETFEAAKKRLNLTDNDILIKQKSLFRLAVLMFASACLLFCYFVYNLLLAHFAAAFVTWIVMSLAFVLAFRYHFWYFQIKQKKLGCTASQWFKEGLCKR